MIAHVASAIALLLAVPGVEGADPPLTAVLRRLIPLVPARRRT
jgi:hypothetical protein